MKRNLMVIIPPSRNILVCLLLVVSQLVFSNAVHAQQRIFDVIRNDDKVGTLSATSSNTSFGQLLSIESHVKVWMLISIKVNYNQSNLYKDGLLKHASVMRTVNGSTKVKNYIIWRPSGYVCLKKDGDSSFHREEIYYTTARLYFVEPVNVSRIYSEAFLQYLILKKTAPHTYELALPDGVKNYYTYEKGLCTKVQAETDHGTIYFVAR